MERQSFSRGEQSLRALSVVASGYGVRVCSSPGPTHCDGKGVMVKKINIVEEELNILVIFLFVRL